MQWSLHWYDFIFISIVTYVPYVAVLIAVILIIRDVVTKRGHRSTIAAVIIAIVLCVIVAMLQKVI